MNTIELESNVPLSRRLAAMDATRNPSWRAAVRPEPDTPDDPDNGGEIPDVNPGSNPGNPGDQPAVTEPDQPAEVVAAHRALLDQASGRVANQRM